jgi:hypothetical protein
MPMDLPKPPCCGGYTNYSQLPLNRKITFNFVVILQRNVFNEIHIKTLFNAFLNGVDKTIKFKSNPTTVNLAVAQK